MSQMLSRFGNSLHDGTRSLPIVRRRRTWYTISLVVVIVLGGLALLRGPTLGIEFTGGSEFQVAGVSDVDQTAARDIVREQVPDSEPKITLIGGDTLRVQTAQLDSTQTAELAADLAEGYGVDASAVSTSYIGPVWSGDITQKMLRGVLAFLVLVAVGMALYFRDLRASGAAMLALVHDMLITAGVYGVVGFEITPGTVIGFLTILGYSLYDTIVVFDKVRENTEGLSGSALGGSEYAGRVELAANQTLVRSINTSVVALLPVGSILVIGAFLLGAGTLKDISLALFVGILAGTYSSIFLAPGLLVDLHRIGRRTAPAPAARAPRAARTAGRTAPRAAVSPDDADDAADSEEADPTPDAEDTAAPDTDDPGDGPAAEDDRAARPTTTRQQPRRRARRDRSSRDRGAR